MAWNWKSDSSHCLTAGTCKIVKLRNWLYQRVIIGIFLKAWVEMIYLLGRLKIWNDYFSVQNIRIHISRKKRIDCWISQWQKSPKSAKFESGIQVYIPQGRQQSINTLSFPVNIWECLKSAEILNVFLCFSLDLKLRMKLRFACLTYLWMIMAHLKVSYSWNRNFGNLPIASHLILINFQLCHIAHVNMVIFAIQIAKHPWMISCDVVINPHSETWINIQYSVCQVIQKRSISFKILCGCAIIFKPIQKNSHIQFGSG